MRLLTLLLLIGLSPVVYAGSVAVPNAYAKAASLYQVNPGVLYAIAKAESSRKHYPHPWPWTANIKGKGYYYSSRKALYLALSRQLGLGQRNFDVGLMQINWRHNRHLFNANLWSATDPYNNIIAGARHLKGLLKQHHHKYDIAVGLYHAGNTNTPARKLRAEKYQKRVWSYLGQLSKRSRG